jgi:hypothetical protein
MKSQVRYIPPKHFLWVVVSIAALTLGAASERTIYSNTSNKELKQKTLQLVKNVKELVYSYNKKDRELMSEYDKKTSPRSES